MAKSQKDRDAAAKAKRDASGEVELRHRVRPGILAMLRDLMSWGGFSQLAECVQAIIMNIHALGPEGAKSLLQVQRHEIRISENVARDFEQQSLREIQRDPGDEIVAPTR